MKWRTRAGDEMEARLGEGNTKDITSQAWRTALEPKGEWIPAVLRAADRRLTEVRHTIPDAGGLVIATDQTMARAYAAILQDITGQPPTVVLSDEKEASDRIEQFAGNTSRWLVAVRMVSEGVDVPRLAVGVYATSSSTPLFFAQAIGRFVRARRRGETASVFLPERARSSWPSQPPSSSSATTPSTVDATTRPRGTCTTPRTPWWPRRTARNGPRRLSPTSSASRRWRPAPTSTGCSSTATSTARSPSPAASRSSTSSASPGSWSPSRCPTCCAPAQARQARRATERRRSAPEDAEPEDVPLYRTIKEQRTLLSSLVGMWSKLSGEPHAMIHTELRRLCGGPAVPQASVTQLQARIELLRKRLGRSH